MNIDMEMPEDLRQALEENPEIVTDTKEALTTALKAVTAVLNAGMKTEDPRFISSVPRLIQAGILLSRMIDFTSEHEDGNIEQAQRASGAEA